MLEKELETAIALARLAGKQILEYYITDFLAEEKLGVDNNFEPVTIADRHASRIIVDGLAEAFPDDAFLSEEEPDDAEFRLSKERVWIIDPLDGTAGFVKHDGDFAVQIGLAVAGIPLVGVVFVPLQDTLYYASKDAGSFSVIGNEIPVGLQTSKRSEFSDMTLAMSRNHPSPGMGRIIEHLGLTQIIKRGSVGLKVGLIAEQTCDIYIHPSPRTKIWDTCAPQIILEEAGGTLTDIFGNKMRYNRRELQNHNGILATNGIAHANAATRLKPLLKEFGRVENKY